MDNSNEREHSRITMEFKDISNGTVFASAIGTYVNSYSHPKEQFYTRMLEKSIGIQHNFTMLCLEWFRVLSKWGAFDQRNKASREFAVKAVNEYCFESLNKRKYSSKGVSRHFEFDYTSDEQAADLVEKYLRLSESDNEFMNSMLSIHPTCQQSFTGLCCEWLKRVAELPTRRRPYVVLARKVVKHYTRFPMI